MQIKQRILVTSLSLVLMGGCAQVNKPAPASPAPTGSAVKPGGQQQAWQQRQTTFMKMASWRLQGRVGLQFRDQSNSFGIDWSQQGANQYVMNIKHPLTGAVIAVLNGGASDVTLQANGKTLKDVDAERLLKSQVGASIPVSGMKYWVRGIPAPNAPVDHVELDFAGRPKVIQQSGWRIDYSEWQNNSWNALPDKVSMTRAAENTKVKVLAKDWQTRF